MTKSILEEVREKMTSFGGSEHEAQENMPALQGMWDQVQALKQEMNAAKKKASEEAAKPYLDAIAEIERRYAFILKLSS